MFNWQISLKVTYMQITSSFCFIFLASRLGFTAISVLTKLFKSNLCSQVLIRALAWVHTLGLPQNTGETPGMSLSLYFNLIFISLMWTISHIASPGCMFSNIFSELLWWFFKPHYYLDRFRIELVQHRRYFYCLDKLSLSSWKERKRWERKWNLHLTK